MIRALYSEITKLAQPTYWIAIAAMVAFMAITVVISVGSPGETNSHRGPAGLILSQSELQQPDGLARSLGNAVTFLGIVVLSIVGVNMGGEYRLGTIRNLVTRQPRRVRLLVGKLTALLAYLAVAVVITVLVAVPLARQLAARAGVDSSRWWSGDGVIALLGGTGSLIVAVWGWGSLALLLAIVLRSAPATIGVGVAYALPVEILVGEIWPAFARWLPGQLFQALARGGSPSLDHTDALIGSLTCLALATVLALAIFRARDIPE